MKAAKYSPGFGREGWIVKVLKENPDGTVDLGDATGKLLVGSCPVSTEPITGHCVLTGDEFPEPKKAPVTPPETKAPVTPPETKK